MNCINQWEVETIIPQMEAFLLFLAQVRLWLIVISGEISSKRRWFLIFVVTVRLFDQKMCAIAAKQHKCRFLVLEKEIQKVAAVFALFNVVETRRFIG